MTAPCFRRPSEDDMPGGHLSFQALFEARP